MRKLALLIVVAVFSLVAGNGTGVCDVTKANNGDSIHYGGSYTEAVVGNPNTLNLWIAADSTSLDVTGVLFESLIAQNPQTGRWEGRLAELPEVSADGLKYTFHLRPDLRWSDGNDLTADDVVFTYKLIYDESVECMWRDSMLVPVTSRSGQTAYKPVACRKIDERTVEFTFPARYAPGLSLLNFPIAPRHKLEADWQAGEFNRAWDTSTPAKNLVSSSAWMMESYQPGNRVVYRRNPNFWRKDAQGRNLPYLDKYVLLLRNQWHSTVEIGDRSIVDGGDLQPAEYAQFQKKPVKGFTARNCGSSWGTTFLCFNQNPNARIDAGKRELFRNVVFRRAVSHAINREALVKTLFAGQAKPLYGPVTPADSLFYNSTIPRYSYNPSQARKLLRQAGLGDSNRNGFWEWKGRELRIEICTNLENDVRVRMCAMVVHDLRAAGINAVAKNVAFSELIKRLDTRTVSWEAALLGFTGSREPNDGANIWRSSGNMHMWNPMQRKPATPWEVEIDRLFVQGVQAHSEAARKKIYDRWQVVAAQQQPLIYLVVPDSSTVVRTKFGNVKPVPGNVSWNLEEIYDRTATRELP